LSCSSKNDEHTVKGQVINRPQTTHLLLYKQNEDPRIQSTEIPVTDGAFEYTIDNKHVEKYELAYKDEFETNSWTPVSFFSEAEVVELILHPTEQAENNKVKGSALTQSYW